MWVFVRVVFDIVLVFMFFQLVVIEMDPELPKYILHGSFATIQLFLFIPIFSSLV